MSVMTCAVRDGKILLRNMLERAPSLGIRNVLAVIFGHNHVSLRLFHSMGFQEWGAAAAGVRFGNLCRRLVVILGKKDFGLSRLEEGGRLKPVFQTASSVMREGRLNDTAVVISARAAVPPNVV